MWKVVVSFLGKVMFWRPMLQCQLQHVQAFVQYLLRRTTFANDLERSALVTFIFNSRADLDPERPWPSSERNLQRMFSRKSVPDRLLKNWETTRYLQIEPYQKNRTSQISKKIFQISIVMCKITMSRRCCKSKSIQTRTRPWILKYRHFDAPTLHLVWVDAFQVYCSK